MEYNPKQIELLIRALEGYYAPHISHNHPEVTMCDRLEASKILEDLKQQQNDEEFEEQYGD